MELKKLIYISDSDKPFVEVI